MQSEDYFVKHEQISERGRKMILLDVRLDNLYAFKNFHINLTYPKKIVGSSIKDEHLADRPNFRYKKVNIIMGANASGKTTFGRTIMKIFNFIDKKNYSFITDIVANQKEEATFILDMASGDNIFYRISCRITPPTGEKYNAENIHLQIRQEAIQPKDSYESCVRRMEALEYIPMENYIEELEKFCALDWLFLYPEDEGVLRFHKNEHKFGQILEYILKALDPSIQSVKKSSDIEDAYVVRLQNKALILQNGEKLKNEFLSSGTKAGIGIAQMVSAIKHSLYSFYYCDERFSYIHSDLEKAILSLMIEYLDSNDQLFFTTHNTDVLDMDLPKHSFTFLCKDISNKEMPISCITASSVLKRNTDSLKSAVENDMFACAPAVDLIYAIGDL